MVARVLHFLVHDFRRYTVDGDSGEWAGRVNCITHADLWKLMDLHCVFISGTAVPGSFGLQVQGDFEAMSLKRASRA